MKTMQFLNLPAVHAPIAYHPFGTVSPAVTPFSMAAKKPNPEGFNIERVCESFEKCSENEDGLLIDKYLEAYWELYRFFQIMGSVFSFVASDVHDKINILEGYRRSDTGSNYQTIESMIAFEQDNDLLAKPERPSGCRTLLRLHRALEFISSFMRALGRAGPNDATSTIAQNSYKETLSKFHPWLVQKGAMLAMYALPYRDQLIEKVHSEKDGAQNARIVMEKLADSADRVYNMTQKLYEQQELLDLP